VQARARVSGDNVAKAVLVAPLDRGKRGVAGQFAAQCADRQPCRSAQAMTLAISSRAVRFSGFCVPLLA
jgi:hypothetical protein